MLQYTYSQFCDFVKHIDIVDLDTHNNLFNRMSENHGNLGTNKIIYLITGGIATGKSVITYNLIRHFKLGNLPYVSSDTYYYKYYNLIANFDEGYACARTHTDEVLNRYLQNGYSFVWETVLSKAKKEIFLKNCIQKGYKICTLFIGVETPEISFERATLRKREGYHGVNCEFINDRFKKSIDSLNWILKISNIFVAIDNTALPSLIYYFGADGVFRSSNIPNWFIQFIKD